MDDRRRRSPSIGRRWCCSRPRSTASSQFCGPDAEALAQLAKDYPDRAVFIHIEIWNLFTQDEKIANEAAADWLYRDGDLTEPWLYLIGADGKIADRWGPLFDPAQVGGDARRPAADGAKDDGDG